jgi:hypothetical protein
MRQWLADQASRAPQSQLHARRNPTYTRCANPVTVRHSSGVLAKYACSGNLVLPDNILTKAAIKVSTMADQIAQENPRDVGPIHGNRAV